VFLLVFFKLNYFFKKLDASNLKLLFFLQLIKSKNNCKPFNVLSFYKTFYTSTMFSSIIVFKFAVKGMADVSYELMERNNLTGDDIAWLVPHQANLRIIDATANRMNLPKEKVMINIQKFGNTTAGTLPLCLWEWENQLKKGDNVILASFGGGFTWGATWIKWAYDPK
jgi:3-oxoacyl-[acyl-carrier-protein] synthase III